MGLVAENHSQASIGPRILRAMVDPGALFPHCVAGGASTFWALSLPPLRTFCQDGIYLNLQDEI